MNQSKDTYSLAVKYKLLVYLTLKNDKRSINMVKHFAKSINVLYVTADSIDVDKLYHPNIEIYDFKTILSGLSRININLSIIKLIQKIESICKSEYFSHEQLVFISNNIKFVQLLTHFSKAAIHFDFKLDANPSIIDKMMDKRLYLITNSITTSTIKQRLLFDNYFKGTFRICDGIENNLKIYPEDNKVNEKPLIGCFVSKPEFLNYDLIYKIARIYPSYEFKYISNVEFEPCENIDNLSFITSNDSYLNYDLVFLPFKKDYYEYTNVVFYENLCYSAPVCAFKSPDMDVHKKLVTTYLTENDLIKSFEHLPEKVSDFFIERSVLLKNSSWGSRARQLENVILS
ncbi:MAG: hypothetical protein AB7V50_11455 [Vampirovibrionia bacterium]